MKTIILLSFLFLTTFVNSQTISINDTTVIYLPDQTNFIGSIFYGNGGENLTYYNYPNGQYNTGVGINTLASLTTGAANTAVGANVMYNTTTAQNNTALGYFSMLYNTTGSANVALGQNTLVFNKTGSANTIIGGATGYNGNLDSCTLVGWRAGFGTTNKGLNQKGQIKIGNRAGFNDSTNYTLYIDNSSTTDFNKPLIGGRLDLNRVSINKEMPTCGDSTFNVGGGMDVDGGVKISKSITISQVIKQTQLVCNLTDGYPTQIEMTNCAGAPLAAGIIRNIRDNSDGKVYILISDETEWNFILSTKP